MAQTSVAAPQSAVKDGNVTRRIFAASILARLGITPNRENLRGLVAWMQAEGGATNNSRTWNPLNTTQKADGATYGGTQGNIAAYPDFQTGLDATVTTLENGRYGSILTALKAGTAADIENAVHSTPWGTKGAFPNVTTASYDAQIGHVNDKSVLDRIGSYLGPFGFLNEIKDIGGAILPDSVGEKIKDVVPGAALLQKLADGRIWVQVLYVVGGVVVGVIGIIVLVKNTSVGKAATTAVGTAAKTTAAAAVVA